MPNLLDAHSKNLTLQVKSFGRPVILTDPEGPTEYPDLMAIWNDVEHVLKVENLNADPMGAKSSLYFDRESLGTTDPKEGWTAFGSPNKFDPEKEYKIRIPKLDKQLPGVLLFLEEVNPDVQNFPAPQDQGS